MGKKEKDEAHDGRIAPPDVDPTPAAQPPSPQPSITGAETGIIPSEGRQEEFLFSVDWLAFTVPGSTVEDVQQRVGGDWMELEKGFNGYPRAWLCLSTGGGSGRMGTGMPHRAREVHVSLSGEIVSAWKQEKVQATCRWIKELKGHGTRIDLALDDRTGHATVSHVIAAADAAQAVMRWSTYDAKRQCSYKGQDHIRGEMVTFGSRQSQSYLRVYDKRIEAQVKGEVVDGPWVRWELEFKKERAQLCVNLFAHLPLDEWRECTVGLLKSCISFRDTTADAPAWERCRSSELPWWKALTEDFKRCRFHVETTDRKLEEVLAWFSKAMGPTIAALYCAAGPEWVAKVIESGSSRWKAPHYQLMKQKKPKRSYLLNDK